MEDLELAQRIWDRDGAAWTDDLSAQQMVPTALGWLDAPSLAADLVGDLEAFAGEIHGAGVTHVVLLGMGGSSLCPEVLRQTFGSRSGFPALSVLDTTHPDAIAEAERSVDLERALFLVSSKSGGTTETLSLFHYFYGRVSSLKGDRAGQSFVALTDPGTSLERLASERGFRRVFSTPPDVGGRYSALTTFGLLPAALLGLDVRTLVARAREMAQRCTAAEPESNPGLKLGLFLGRNALAGRDKLTLILSPAIASLGLWIEQLIAESTGKQGRGIVPIDGEPVGPPSAYANDRIFVDLWLDSPPGKAVAGDEQLDRQVDLLEQAGQPVCELALRDLLDLGAEFFRWEFATAVAGAVLRINAFDQPNVQESKDNTDAVLADFAARGALQAATPASAEEVAAFLRQAVAGDYVALQAYLPYSTATDEALRGLRVSVRDALSVATTAGYGPRFLHSTGQLHKGGPNSGLFIQIVDEPSRDLEIPDQPYSFATLIRAQALGDLRSLQAHGRRVIRFDVGDDRAGGLERLRRVLDQALRGDR